MTEGLRAVLDTNVILAAYFSRNPRSPTVELLTRWRRAEFTALYSRQIRKEYERKLRESAIAGEEIAEFLDALSWLGTRVSLLAQQILPVTHDPKDDVFVACAIVGHATHLVTYDPHIRQLGATYRGVHIVEALEFLYLVRGDTPPMIR